MSGVVFMHTLRRNWRGGLYWGIGLMLLGAYVLIVIPNVDMLQQYADLAATMPPMLLQMFGADDVATLATPEGFLGFGLFGYSLLILSAYAVIAGLNVTANEEDRGILDVTLSLPIPRWRLVIERLLAYSLIVILILVVLYVGMVAVMLTASGITISAARLLEGVFNLLPSTLLVLAVTALAGAALRSRGMAAAVATAFVIISYFIDFIGKAASETAAASLRGLSYFSYYDGSNIMSTGLVWGSVGLLLVGGVIFAAGALWFFERRDIAV